MMAVLDPIKLVIDNYPEGQVEYLDVANNLENEELGIRKVPLDENFISKEKILWKSRRKIFRLFPEMKYRRCMRIL